MIKVSALVSVYKAQEFIDGCLLDLVQQSLFLRGELEIVVIDSNSPQDERRIIERYQERFPNIVYHRTPEREPLYQAWNRGIELARGEYVTNANCDDRHHPGGIEVLSEVLDTHPAIDLAYADVFESRLENERFVDNQGIARYSYPDYFAPQSLLFYQFGCQPVWRKRIHSKMGLFSADLRAAGDWEFSIRFALAGLQALHVPQVLGSFLTRTNSISQQDTTSFNEQAQVKKRFLTQQSILSLYKVEGWPTATSEERVKVFTDFAIRASEVVLPWEPGRSFKDPIALLTGCQAAFDEAKSDVRAYWNLGVALLTCGQTEYAKPILMHGLQSRDPRIVEAWRLAHEGSMTHLAFLPIR
jgi:hypothetical protein